MSDKKLKKCGVIRGNSINPCPFGLSIPTACCNIGDEITRMAPTEITKNKEEKEKIVKSNKIIYTYHKNGKQCKFADKVIENYDKVDCDFQDTGEGQKSVQYQGSPIYPRTFSGMGLDGLHGYPLGLYSDQYGMARNLFFGLFSFLGSDNHEKLIKLANKYDEAGEEDKADIIDQVIENIEKCRDDEDLEEQLKQIEKFLEEYKDKFEEERFDEGLIWKVIDQYTNRAI